MQIEFSRRDAHVCARVRESERENDIKNCCERGKSYTKRRVIVCVDARNSY